MALSFQPYVDKENSGIHGTQPHKSGIPHSVRGGKVFGGSNQSIVTPRKALGDVNQDLKVNTSKSSGLKPLNPQALKPKQIPAQKGLQIRNGNTKIQPLSFKSSNIQVSQDSGMNRKKMMAPPNTVTKQKTIVNSIKPVEEKEKMFIYKDDADDDFEDIWPKSERISTYIHKLITWRPPCLFGDMVSDTDEEEEDNEEAFRKRLEENDRILELSLPKHDTHEENTIKDEDLFVLDNLEDIPLPSLDDSINLIPSTGKLQIQD